MIYYTKYITINQAKRSGQPCIRDSSLTVYDVVSYLAAADTIEEILENFSIINRNDILARMA